jgi:hypothetical protein
VLKVLNSFKKASKEKGLNKRGEKNERRKKTKFENIIIFVRGEEYIH